MSKDSQTESEAFKNFRELTKNLMSVPKKEIEQNKSAHKNRKKRGSEKQTK
jgi:hypothetical protein